MEIVPSTVGTFESMGRQFRICADTETIIRFEDPRYDYLRYVDDEQGCLAIVWLGKEALETLVEFGIPQTVPRETISSQEYEEWVSWEAAQDMAQFEAEIDDAL